MTNTEKRELELQREAYIQGLLRWIPDEFTRENAQDLALRRYPDPKEPTIMTDSEGNEWRYVDGVLYRKGRGYTAWYTYDHDLTPSMVIGLAELAQESIDRQSPSLSSDTGVQ